MTFFTISQNNYDLQKLNSDVHIIQALPNYIIWVYYIDGQYQFWDLSKDEGKIIKEGVIEKQIKMACILNDNTLILYGQESQKLYLLENKEDVNRQLTDEEKKIRNKLMQEQQSKFEEQKENDEQNQMELYFHFDFDNYNYKQFETIVPTNKAITGANRSNEQQMEKVIETSQFISFIETGAVLLLEKRNQIPNKTQNILSTYQPFIYNRPIKQIVFETPKRFDLIQPIDNKSKVVILKSQNQNENIEIYLYDILGDNEPQKIIFNEGQPQYRVEMTILSVTPFQENHIAFWGNPTQGSPTLIIQNLLDPQQQPWKQDLQEIVESEFLLNKVIDVNPQKQTALFEGTLDTRQFKILNFNLQTITYSIEVQAHIFKLEYSSDKKYFILHSESKDKDTIYQVQLNNIVNIKAQILQFMRMKQLTEVYDESIIKQVVQSLCLEEYENISSEDEYGEYEEEQDQYQKQKQNSQVLQEKEIQEEEEEFKNQNNLIENQNSWQKNQDIINNINRDDQENINTSLNNESKVNLINSNNEQEFEKNCDFQLDQEALEYHLKNEEKGEGEQQIIDEYQKHKENELLRQEQDHTELD